MPRPVQVVEVFARGGVQAGSGASGLDAVEHPGSQRRQHGGQVRGVRIALGVVVAALEQIAGDPVGPVEGQGC
ncbi:hypothetical protein [Nocardia cyriacigeorgica]|uniref:hypothetical protein n=1 Tax=Nocardia cyriacigeorgica TaxID=135487 RepID=UPI001E5D0BA1|nr:hypothetical protein [Nocardia cyriacigeorgica]